MNEAEYQRWLWMFEMGMADESEFEWAERTRSAEKVGKDG